MLGFAKKVEIEVPDGRGGTKKIKVSKTQFDQWIAEGRISPVSACKVHVSDVMRGEYETTMIIGKDVDQATYDKFKDENGELYVWSVYTAGKPEWYFSPRDKWEVIRNVGR
jgi:hypothetical protein